MSLKTFSLICIALFVCCACRQAAKKSNAGTSSLYKKAIQLLDQGRTDLSFYYFNETANATKDSLEIAMAYNYMAAIQSDAGDYFGAQESVISSLKFLNEEKKAHHSCLAADYNELAMTNSKLKNYDQALYDYDQALKFSADQNDRLIFLNNQANIYQRKKLYSKAIGLYQTILAHHAADTKEYARTLTNLAFTRWLNDPRYPAAAALRKALAIRFKAKDAWGQNSSFAHLADFYLSANRDSALYFAQKMYTVSQQIRSPEDQLEALQKLIRLAPAMLIQPYFTRYQQISDSLTTVRNAAKNQFALIRYETQKNKAQALRLQKDNTQKQYQIIKQWFLLAACLALMIAAWFWYQKRKQRLELEAQAKIKAGELRVSKKVHDVVANGLYRVMNEVEYGNEIDKDKLLDQLEDMYEQSRDISYEKASPVSQNYAGKITELINAFKSGAIKLAVEGNDSVLWDLVPNPVKRELEAVLQELMVNLSKHSGASQALVSFSIASESLRVVYQDNGIGLPPDFRYGNGLTNTVSRIHSLNGRLIFETQTKPGLHLNLIIPLK